MYFMFIKIDENEIIEMNHRNDVGHFIGICRKKQKSRYWNNRTIVNRIFNDVFTLCCVVYKQLFTLSFITIHKKRTE